ncbi:MAG: cytochrome c [Thermodesulfovibrionales bacterium]
MLSSTRLLIILFCALLAVFVVSFPSGKAVFEREQCLGCHRFKDRGGMLGPDLTEVSKRHSTFWIASQIRDPKRHNANSRMPGYPHLSFLERYAIAQHLSF